MKSLFLSLLIITFAFQGIGQELAATDQEGLAKFTILDPKGIPEEGAIVKVVAVDKKFSKQATTDIDGKCAILIF